MRREQHLCNVPGCKRLCWWRRPFCRTCWRDIPQAEREAVLVELAKYKTDDDDPTALRLAVAAAVERLETKPPGPGAWFWEAAYMAAGRPEI